jgi:predicted nucleic acid-binding protein
MRINRPKPLKFAFWDTSAILPLCSAQRQSAQVRQTTRLFRLVVWWGTSIEARSGIHRLIRERHLTRSEGEQAINRLQQLRLRWDEVTPTEAVRDTAELLLGRHKLRAGDALQLAAALEWCNYHPRGKVFISSDGDLFEAASAEGFTCHQMI